MTTDSLHRYWPSSAVLAVSLLGTGCSSSPAATASADAGTTFVAFASDFTGFRSWSSTPGVAPDGAPQPPTSGSAALHVGSLTTYINARPPAGSSAFPVGTIIVKEPTTIPLAQRQIFAMVKRGGGFNAGGATDWEWFELQSTDASDTDIVWRGAGPPLGQSYGGDPDVCNSCHAQSTNDFVWTEGLALGR